MWTVKTGATALRHVAEIKNTFKLSSLRLHTLHNLTDSIMADPVLQAQE